jgi:hypothetical protein
MNNELKYKIQVEPALFNTFEQMAADMPNFGISKHEFYRAIWTWSADQLSNEYITPPDWLVEMYETRARKASEANTIDGETAGL